MQSKAHRTHFWACAVFLCLAVLTVLSCASIRPAEVKQESGYYYGFGSGSSALEAADAAKQNLISNALSESARLDGSRKGRIEIGEEAAKAYKLPELQPVAQEKAAGSATVVYRIKATEWDKYKEARETAIKTELMEKLAALKDGSGLPLALRVLDAGSLLDRLSKEGLAELLTEKGPGSPLVSSTIESFCREITAGLSIKASPEGGFIGKDTVFTAQVLTRDGKPAGSLPLLAEWTAKEVEPAFSSVTAGPDGKAILAYPAAESFRNRGIRVRISTDFARSAPHSEGLKNIDDTTLVEAHYRHFDDVAKYFGSEVLVPGGSFTAGSPARDKRAAKKEAPRQARTSDFYIDIYPVTNALYEMFLDDTRAEAFPDYWDNPEYNLPDQPVIGVSFEYANRFASGLSIRLGVVKRLPTEDEWEKAARGGQDVIYPWGDQSPADGARANYNGNGRFNATSPVGHFEAGKNAYGIFDMAGNIWQWTSTAKEAGTGNKIVKGGSWMDGPNELRVSNRRDIDPSKGYVDVGFRLVREALHE
jgi:hypothetical protein